MAINPNDHFQTAFEQPFSPNHDRLKMPTPEQRVAHAAEYAAYQLGEIRRLLAKLVESHDSSDEVGKSAP